MIICGSPDQYQYHQNQLIKKIAEHILVKFYKWAQQQYNEKQLEKHKGI
jgi:hypothetical protein